MVVVEVVVDVEVVVVVAAAVVRYRTLCEALCVFFPSCFIFPGARVSFGISLALSRCVFRRLPCARALYRKHLHLLTVPGGCARAWGTRANIAAAAAAQAT